MKRRQRQLARVRESQTQTPLTPYSVTSGPPTPAAAEIAAAREERIETAIRRDAVVFGLKLQLQWEESDHKKERKEAQEQFARLLSRIERLEQDISAQWSHFNNRWVVAAELHKQKLLALVRDGQFCKNAAANHEDIVAEIDSKENTKCQNQ